MTINEIKEMLNADEIKKDEILTALDELSTEMDNLEKERDEAVQSFMNGKNKKDEDEDNGLYGDVE